jgi:hypothetical protein
LRYSVDGIPVTIDYFRLQLDHAFHGPFGLAEASAQASALRLRNYDVALYHGRLLRDYGLNGDKAISEALETNSTLIRNWLVNDNWALDWAVLAPPPQKTNILPLPDIPGSLEFLLRRGGCGTFVQKLINQLGTKDNPFSSDYLPDLLSGVKIDFSQQYDSKGNPVAGRAYARDKDGVAKLGLSPTDATSLTPYGYRQNTYEYVETVIHELIHFSGSKGRYTDREVVLALDAMGAIPDGDWKKAFNRLSKDDVHGNSGFFDGILRLHCAGPPVRPGD